MAIDNNHKSIQENYSVAVVFFVAYKFTKKYFNFKLIDNYVILNLYIYKEGSPR